MGRPESAACLIGACSVHAVGSQGKAMARSWASEVRATRALPPRLQQQHLRHTCPLQGRWIMAGLADAGRRHIHWRHVDNPADAGAMSQSMSQMEVVAVQMRSSADSTVGGDESAAAAIVICMHIASSACTSTWRGLAAAQMVAELTRDIPSPCLLGASMPTWLSGIINTVPYFAGGA